MRKHVKTLNLNLRSRVLIIDMIQLQADLAACLYHTSSLVGYGNSKDNIKEMVKYFNSTGIPLHIFHITISLVGRNSYMYETPSKGNLSC